MRFARTAAAAWCFALLADPSPASASWATNGNPASLAAQNQVNAQGAPDGSGGVILAWEDYQNGAADIYAQRLDAAGVPQWGANGVAVCIEANAQESPVIVSDGQGGAVIAWQDLRNGQYDIFAQAVDENGAVRWTAGGVALCAAAGNQVLQVIATDGLGGAVVAWRDLRTGDSDIYAQRVTSAGAVPWAPDGVGVCVVAGLQTDVRVQSDPRGGAFVVWRDRRGGLTSDLYAQSLDESGAPRWTANGVPVCAAALDQLGPAIAADGRFGLLVAWHDFRNGAHFDVWAQRLGPDGAPRWTVDGVRLTNATGQQTNSILVPDGQAGAIVAWTDARVPRPDIYAQRVDSLGAVQWSPADGAAVCAADSSQFLAAGVSDGLGGAIFGWDDDRAGFQEVFAQAIGPDGTARWGAGGLKIATGSGSRTLSTAVADGFHGAIFGWEDFRNGPTADVYAYRITSLGTSVEPAAAPRASARIYPARPNPFNPSTLLEFSLEEAATVSFAIYDVQGRLVRLLADGPFGAGRHAVRWDGLDRHGRACGSGVYFARLAHAGGSQRTAVTLVR